MRSHLSISRHARQVLLLLCHVGLLCLLPSSAPTADNPDTLTGRVVKPDKTPVQGAIVRMIDADVDLHAYVQIAQASTDGDGFFHFTHAVTLRAHHSTPIIATLVEGWGISFLNYNWADSSPVMVLHPAAAVRIAFVDQYGKPTAGVRATVASLGVDKLGWVTCCKELKNALAQTSDAQGICTLRGLVRGANIRISIDNRRFAALAVEQEFLKLGQVMVTAEKLPIKLLPSASIRGRIVEASTGNPVGGVHILALSPHAQYSGEAVTDAGGMYTVGQLRPDSYRVGLDLTPEQMKVWTSVWHDSILVGKGQHLNGINLTLFNGATLSGVVRDAETGQPLAGVAVCATSTSTKQTDYTVEIAATSGVDGHYLVHVPPGEYRLHITDLPAGYIRPYVHEKVTFAAKDGEKVIHDIALTPAKANPGGSRKLSTP